MANNYVACGGALIAPDLVLTAAHCGSKQGRTIKIGAYKLTNLAGNAEYRTCERYEEHPDYVHWTEHNGDDFLDYDFALCKLNEPIDIDESKVRLVLNEDDNFPVQGKDAVLRIMGFGHTSYGGAGTKFLHHVNATYVPNDECREALRWDHINDLKLCAGGGSKNSCQGDSGGPVVLVQDGADGGPDLHIHVGLNSYGAACGTGGYPGVKARTSKGIDWIKETACTLGSVFCSSSEAPTPTPTEAPTPTRTEAPTPTPTECSDSFLDIVTPSGVIKDCSWVLALEKRCKNKYRFSCRQSCGVCDECRDARFRFRFKPDPSVDSYSTRTCGYVRQNKKLCSRPDLAATCPKTCGVC
jgi:secreted trypsin-like serine protease